MGRTNHFYVAFSLQQIHWYSSRSSALKHNIFEKFGDFCRDQIVLRRVSVVQQNILALSFLSKGNHSPMHDSPTSTTKVTLTTPSTSWWWLSGDRLLWRYSEQTLRLLSSWLPHRRLVQKVCIADTLHQNNWVANIHFSQFAKISGQLFVKFKFKF